MHTESYHVTSVHTQGSNKCAFLKYKLFIIKYPFNTTNTFVLNDKNRLHVSAYHKPSSGQLFTNSTNYILICVRHMGSHMAYSY
jgi:hypothetical protein